MLMRSPNHNKLLNKSSFSPVNSNLLQRKCDCGQCSQCDRQNSDSQHSKSSQVPPVMHESSNFFSLPEQYNNKNIIRVAQSGVSGKPKPLPYLEKIQRSFGRHKLENINSYIGGTARRANEKMGSTAYSIDSNNIAFKQTPDLYSAAHEAAHIIQQRSALRLENNIGRKDELYEQQADAVADAVVKGNSAESILDTYSKDISQSSIPQLQFQRRPPTMLRRPLFVRGRGERRMNIGTMSWFFLPRNNPRMRRGGSVRVHIRFVPNEALASTANQNNPITFIQTVVDYNNSDLNDPDATRWLPEVDMLSHERDPYYGAQRNPDTGEWESEGGRSHPFTGTEGSAELVDTPMIPEGQTKIFETVAVHIVDNQPVVLASLQWKVEVENYQTRIAVERFNEGRTSNSFTETLEMYNSNR